MKEHILSSNIEADSSHLLSNLLEEGYVLMRTDSEDIEDVLVRIGKKWGQLVPHDSDVSSLVWNIKPQPQGKARSHTAEPFDFHTDSSFENPPPRIIGMAVICPDSFGAGHSLLLSKQEVLGLLRDQDIELLRQPIFELEVPEEFQKGRRVETLPLLFGGSFIRYRPDTISIDPTHREAISALANLRAAISTASKNAISKYLKRGQLLFVDNWSYLHGRTEVKDPSRHLLRIRLALDNKILG